MTTYYAAPYDPTKKDKNGLPLVGVKLFAVHNGRLPYEFRDGLPAGSVEITKEQFDIRYSGIRGDELKLINGVPVRVTAEEYAEIERTHYGKE